MLSHSVAQSRQVLVVVPEGVLCDITERIGLKPSSSEVQH